jgi:hypothetical protein
MEFYGRNVPESTDAFPSSGAGEYGDGLKVIAKLTETRTQDIPFRSPITDTAQTTTSLALETKLGLRVRPLAVW